MTVISNTRKVDTAGLEQVAQAKSTDRAIPAPPHGSKMPSPNVDPEKLQKLLGGIRGQVDELAPAAERDRIQMYKKYGVPTDKIPDADQ